MKGPSYFDWEGSSAAEQKALSGGEGAEERRKNSIHHVLLLFSMLYNENISMNAVGEYYFLGIFFVLPCIESYTKVDLRTVSFNVPPQEILTKDSVTVSVDAVVYYRVCNATVSVANVENAHHSTRLLAQTTLRNMLGTKSLAEILSDRDAIAMSMQVNVIVCS
ncbi:unnamed protein product [Toxocara canis]|uniref:PHB domain-containing protein n=1 Tax=Toxocara canis TaxID=6265 RepID=A0A183V2H8_TOXCA|nr:unnamed protein product [Toxocara canis]